MKRSRGSGKKEQVGEGIRRDEEEKVVEGK